MPQSYQSSTDLPHKQAPLSFEHTLKLENVPTRTYPKRSKRELSTPKIYLRGIAHRRDIDDYLTSVEDIEATWSIRLPSGASIGLPGRTGERLDRASVAVAEGSSTDPHRPEWSGISVPAGVAQPFNHGRIRTIAGRSVEAFYGIYDNPDARQVFYPQDYPWRCTGRIFTYTSWPTPNWSWWGSGALIGPRHVLTARPCRPLGFSDLGHALRPCVLGRRLGLRSWGKLLRLGLPRVEHRRQCRGVRHLRPSALPTAGQPTRLDRLKDL